MFRAPTAAQISDQLRRQLRADIPGTDPFIWPNNLYVVSKTMAQALRGLYLRLEWLHAQMFASLAEGEALERHGADIGITRLPETYAIGQINLTGVNNTTVLTGTRFVRTGGQVYRTLKAVTIKNGVGIVDARAVESGREGNADPGTSLRPEDPLAGVSTAEVGEDGMLGGKEVENDASFRARILWRKRNPPHGGSPGEYVGWAREIPYVTRVYVKRATPQAGSVTVMFMTDDSTADGIPTPAMVTEVDNHLQSLAPANANVITVAPTALPINVTVTNLVPDNFVTREQVRSELRAMFRRRAQPGTSAANFIFSRSWIDEAISMAAGETRHILTAPVGDTTCGDGVVATLGTVLFA